MALLILALLQRIFLMSSLMLLLVWLIFFMVLIKLLPILGTISGKTVKLMVLARSEERFSRNAETDLVCRLLLEKKKNIQHMYQYAATMYCRLAFALYLLFHSSAMLLLFFFYFSGHHRDLHSFPTRRSSDLKDISNVVTDAASGVVDIFHGIDKAVADTWNNFWKDGKADGIG